MARAVPQRELRRGAARATVAAAAVWLAACAATHRPPTTMGKLFDAAGMRRLGALGSARAQSAAPWDTTPSTPAALSAVLGDWEVVGHQTPGVSAVTPGDADAWTGRRARYATGAARFAADTCPAPAYAARQLVPAEFIDAYRVSPAQLGIVMAPTVRVWDVGCGGRAWTAPGAQLIEQRPGRLLAPWDGVFYTLARRPAAAGDTADSASARVRGTATFRERLALPDDAVFEATLEDVSRADAPAAVLGRARVERPGNPPFRFEIPYDSAAVDARHAYVVRARITLGDRLFFTTTDAAPVLTRGHGRDVALLLRMVPGR